MTVATEVLRSLLVITLRKSQKQKKLPDENNNSGYNPKKLSETDKIIPELTVSDLDRATEDL